MSSSKDFFKLVEKHPVLYVVTGYLPQKNFFYLKMADFLFGSTGIKILSGYLQHQKNIFLIILFVNAHLSFFSTRD